MGTYGRGRPSKKPPPSKPGEYRLRNKKTGKHDYIGETNDLKRRKREHERSGKFSSQTHDFEWQPAASSSTHKGRRAHEREKIKHHGPSLNVRAGGGGRPPKATGASLHARSRGCGCVVLVALAVGLLCALVLALLYPGRLPGPGRGGRHVTETQVSSRVRVANGIGKVAARCRARHGDASLRPSKSCGRRKAAPSSSIPRRRPVVESKAAYWPS